MEDVQGNNEPLFVGEVQAEWLRSGEQLGMKRVNYRTFVLYHSRFGKCSRRGIGDFAWVMGRDGKVNDASILNKSLAAALLLSGSIFFHR